MKTTTIELIKNVLMGDETVSPEMRNYVLRASVNHPISSP